MAFERLLLLLRMIRPAVILLERWGAPLADLFARLVLFRVFFYAGTAKLDNWSGTLELFQYEYQVPLLPPALAAYMGTASELACSVLLLVGLAARLATLPLIGITLTIQFVLGAANPVYNQLDHFLWLALLLTVLTRGPGVLSLDAWLTRQSGFNVSIQR